MSCGSHELVRYVSCGLKLLVACVRLPPCVSIVLQAGILFSARRSAQCAEDSRDLKGAYSKWAVKNCHRSAAG